MSNPNQRASALSRYLTPMAFKMPAYLTESAWIEHGPFAMWLVETIRPKTIVELGVYSGFSYMAFCQAVRDANLPTSCYGIDTWVGDEHGGFYPEIVFETVKAYNERYYSGFSKLIRARFDDALDYFPDGSIDLLHIDGRHLLDDVNYEFDTWKQKLSPSAVVLFHDTNVRENNFGVWCAWQKLSESFRTFEFVHGNGLGVLVRDEQAGPEALNLLVNATSDEAVLIRVAFSRLGAAVLDRFRAETLEKRLEALVEQVRSTSSEAAEGRRILGELATSPDELRSLREQSLKLQEVSVQAHDLNLRLLSALQRVSDLETIGSLVPHLQTQLSIKEGDSLALERTKAELDSLRARNAALGKQADEASGWLDDLRESRRQLRNIEAQMSTLQSQHLSLQGEHSDLEVHSDQLRQDLERVSNTLVESLAKGENQAQSIQSLRESGLQSRQRRKYRSSRVMKGLQSTLKLSLLSDVRRSRHIRNRIELLTRSGLFDPDWYIQRYPDVIASHVEPMVHFVLHGSAEGRDPGPAFSSSYYLSMYPDVVEAGEEPVYHFIFHGQSEGRRILPAE